VARCRDGVEAARDSEAATRCCPLVPTRVHDSFLLTGFRIVLLRPKGPS
jgi:hypothetical protein